MTLAQSVGQLLTVGFDGRTLPAPLRRRIEASHVGGVMLFRPNIEAPLQVAGLVAAIRDAAPAALPSIVAIDQEGGLVQRMRAPLTVWPDMLSVAAAADEARTFQVGRAIGDELAALGIGWDLAPVLDVHTNPSNPVIGNRAFGTTPASVEIHALAFWRGLRAAGLVGCGKHFPGHGDTTTDSHLGLPVVEHSLERLRRIELPPFAAAAAAGIEAIMTAHVAFPALQAGGVPATLSRALLMDLLRGELHFGGVIVSDDLGMKAVADLHPVEELAVGAVLAGCDVLLIRESADAQERAYEALLAEAVKSASFRGRVEASAARVASLKAACRVGPPLPAAALAERLGTPAHRALADAFVRVNPRDPSTVGSSPVAES